jgi:hypothetical protein
MHQPILMMLFRIGCFIVFCLAVGGVGNAQAQPPEMGLMALGNRMAELELMLESAAIPERDAAEQEILKLGIAALDFLPPVTQSTTTDMRDRLARIRKALELQVVTAITQPSRVTITGDLNLQDTLLQIIKQTGNNVEMKAEFADEAKKFTRNWQSLPFWEAIDVLESEYGLCLDRYGSAPGRINLVPRAVLTPVQLAKRETPIVAYTNTLRLEVTRLEVSKNFVSPEASGTLMDLTIRWEPRLQPIAFDIKYSSLKLIDEFDVEVAVANPDRVFSMMVQPEIPEIEGRFQFPLLERQIESIKTLSGVVEAVLTGRMESFEFERMDTANGPIALQKADATVTLESRAKVDDLQALRLVLSYAEENNALESHRSWAFRNPVYLVTTQGEKIEPIGFETFQQSNQSLGIQYLFVEIPEGAKLIYQTPAAIVKLAVPFEFKNIILP